MAHKAVALIFLTNGLMHGALATRLPQFMEKTGINLAQVGLMYLVFTLAAIISFPLTGSLISRIGSRRVTIYASIGSVFAFLALGTSVGFVTVILFAAFFGFTHGSMDVAMNQQGVEIEDRLARKILVQLHAIWVIGGVTSVGFSYLANVVELAIPIHFLLVAAVIAVIYFLFFPRLLRSGERPEPSPLFVKPSRGLFVLGLLGMLVTLAESGLFEWSTLWITEIAGAPKDWVVIGSLSFYAAMIIARLTLDRVISVFDGIKVMGTSCFIAGIVLCIAVFDGSLIWALIALFVGGLGVAGNVPILLGIAAREPGMAPGMGMASMTIFVYGGGSLGAPIMGFVSQYTSVQTAMGVIAFSLLLGGVSSFLIANQRKRAGL